MNYSLPGFSVHGIFPGKSTGVGCYFLLQGIFLTQGLNPCLLHCRQMLYPLSHQGSPRNNIICMQQIFKGYLQGFGVIRKILSKVVHLKQGNMKFLSEVVKYIYQPSVKPDNEDNCFFFFLILTIFIFSFKCLNITVAKYLLEN